MRSIQDLKNTRRSLRADLKKANLALNLIHKEESRLRKIELSAWYRKERIESAIFKIVAREKVLRGRKKKGP
jgi:hypothetical protein